jgi:hypothetical protein
MARRLRFNGTGSGEGGCPSIHEDLDSREIIVHGPPLTEPEDIAQLQHLGDGEVPIVVPRELLVDFGPKEVTRVPHIIDLDAFNGLFESFKHTAWRLESRRRYASDEATGTWAQFERGEAPAWDMDTPYCRTIRRQTEQGARVERVRLVDTPATPGQLYLLAHAEKNAALGEDIRNLSRDEARRLQLPDEDFWIFDSRLVALLNFDDADNLINVELVTEPVEAVRYSMVRDAAWHHAVPYERFAADLTAKE